MRLLSDILRNKSFNSPVIKGVRAAQVIEEANKQLALLFGEEIKNYASPTFYRNEMLTIAFLSSAAAQELKINEERYLKALNEALGGIKVTRLKYMT